MTVKELKEKLSDFDESREVHVWDMGQGDHVPVDSLALYSNPEGSLVVVIEPGDSPR